MKWTEDDAAALQQTLKITKQVETTHKNLSLPLTFAKLCDFSNLGLMLISPSDKGKTAILGHALCKPPLQHRNIIKLGAVTFRGLKKIASRIDNNSVTIINHDISKLYTEYLKDVMINIMAQLLYDHQIDEMHTMQYDIEIHNAYISFLTGTQPQMYHIISKLPAFESMYKGRFIRMFIFYPLGKPKYKKTPPKIEGITLQKLKWETQLIPPEIFKQTEYQRCLNLMQWHISAGRGKDYLDRLLLASARLNNRLAVHPADLKYVSLFIPYLAMEKWASRRYRGVSQPLEFNADTYTLFFHLLEEGSATRKQLRKHFQVTQTTINRNMKPLIATRLVKGKFGTQTYKPHPEFIKRYVQPIKQYMEFAGA